MKRLTKDLEYHPDGYFTWKTQKSPRVSIGSRAGSVKKNGKSFVEKIQIDGKVYSTHQLVFLLHNGYIPKEIDHIDNNPLNNRIDNLREVTKSQNAKNRGVRADSSTGVKGVFPSKNGKKYVAFVNYKYLGTFETLIDAERVAKEQRLIEDGEYSRHQ